MTKDSYVFSSESVSSGHPDKICDQISDAVLDFYIAQDPKIRVAIEVLATRNKVVIAGEIGTSTLKINPSEIAQIGRETIKRIGYEQPNFNWQTVSIEVYVSAQSLDIAQGVVGEQCGAGDQGIMFGFATNETPDFMPAPIYYAHKLLANLEEIRLSGKVQGLGLDAKSQVSILYKDHRPYAVTAVVLSTQHAEYLDQEQVKKIITPIIYQTIPAELIDREIKMFINPTGRFVIGGPEGDTGLTGRKIIVDTYGGAAPHGGGAFSGKDPSKVDRSGAYVARYMAKNVVAAGLAKRCTIQLSYAIGVVKPVSFLIDTHGTGVVDEGAIEKCLLGALDLGQVGIRERLQLNRPIYQRTASYGHFGRNPMEDGGFSWEKLDLVPLLIQLI